MLHNCTIPHYFSKSSTDIFQKTSNLNWRLQFLELWLRARKRDRWNRMSDIGE
ncbi:hypothetical protein BC938DRAFT_479635 [Jimgerdemannia flammicorona]|uniref:Uncharacterized protein n=1 Tax=Jimgerdemannia flammicorona TaxID=994334 RepID=A0A433QKG5_9FUNG|nr:hypothetical protein BC938DRAFT_479635 [Jimgerdemannia flammicorona]